MREILLAVASDIGGAPMKFGPSIAGGAAGIATFYCHLNRAIPEERFHTLAVRHAAQAVEEANATPWNPAFFSGAPGVIWAVEQMREQDGLDIGHVPSGDTDEQLLASLTHAPWEGSLDVCEGLVGFGLYALHRNTPAAEAILDKVIRRFAATGIRTEDGVTWPMVLAPSPDEPGKGPGEINLGLAHGIPAVIALLGLLCRVSKGLPETRGLLDGAVSWLLSRMNSTGASSAFGNSACIEGRTLDNESRLAWCYGDLGVAAALLVAGTCVGQYSWTKTALEVAERAAARPLEQSGVRDAGLCHGAAGNGHIFNRFYQATGDASFRKAARRWFDVAISFHRPSISIGGFPHWTEFSRSGVQWATPGLLLGASGVGLAFLAALADTEPSWDRLLLVSS